jgi:hypothetical protein
MRDFIFKKCRSENRESVVGTNVARNGKRSAQVCRVSQNPCKLLHSTAVLCVTTSNSFCRSSLTPAA